MSAQTPALLKPNSHQNYQYGKRQRRARRPVSQFICLTAFHTSTTQARQLTSSYLLFSRSYVPRKCSATNRIIKAKDHASVQISIGKVDENGRYTGQNQVYALCGFVRARGEGDDSLNRLAQRDGLLKNVWSGSSQR